MNNTFCASCGNALAEGARFCEGCGAQVGQQPQPQNQSLYQNTAHVRGGNKNYSKIGGWLLFFVIVNIISVARALLIVKNEITGSVDILQYAYGNISTALIINIIAQVTTFAALVLAVMWIIQVFQRKTMFLRILQIESIIMTASYILSFIAISIIGFENYDGNVISTNTSVLVGTVAGFFLMTLYYCKSVRVRTYMGTDEYMNKAIFSYEQTRLY